MLRLRLFGCDRKPDECIEQIDAQRYQLMIEDLFTEILQPLFIPFPPGAKLIDFKVIREEDITTYIATFQSNDGVYIVASRCIIYRTRKLCFPVPLEKGRNDASRHTSEGIPKVELPEMRREEASGDRENSLK